MNLSDKTMMLMEHCNKLYTVLTSDEYKTENEDMTWAQWTDNGQPKLIGSQRVYQSKEREYKNACAQLHQSMMQDLESYTEDEQTDEFENWYRVTYKVGEIDRTSQNGIKWWGAEFTLDVNADGMIHADHRWNEEMDKEFPQWRYRQILTIVELKGYE